MTQKIICATVCEPDTDELRWNGVKWYYLSKRSIEETEERDYRILF